VIEREYNGHTMAVTALSAMEKLMVSGGRDQTTRLWDIESGK